MYLTAIGTALPSLRFTQAECWKAIQGAPQFPGLSSRAQALLRKVLSADNGIATRHACLDGWDEAFQLNPDALQARFTRHAPTLATEAAGNALKQSGLAPQDMDALVISTCTGYLCPGLSSYVAERLGLRRDALLLDLVGQGCGAALPNWRTSESLLAGGRARHVLSICVEVCSAAFYMDEDPGVLISACLFGDGAAATVLSHQPPADRRRVECTSFASRHSPEDRESLRFEHRGGMLRNLLSREVPAIAGREVRALLQDMLLQSGVRQDEIRQYILHAGGREVLSALRRDLDLEESQLSLSAGMLREIGNVSSPFVLFVLARALAGSPPGGWWWMSSFGAGFSAHGALLKVD